MIQYLADQPRLLDAGDHPQFSTTLRTGLDVDGEYPFEPLYPPGLDPGSSVQGVCRCPPFPGLAVAQPCGGAWRSVRITRENELD